MSKAWNGKALTSIIAVSFLLPPPFLQAFPPAPYYRLHGMVRDQVGLVLAVEGAEVILLKGGVNIAKTPITTRQQLDQNYELNIRIDQNRSGTTPYTEKAVQAQGLFSLLVEMNGERFYPIEVSGTLTAGQGGEKIRLDLTLGEDTDHDGLPDVWEAWQLYQAGFYPDGNGNWPLHLIDRNGDFDGDGLSNWLEYVAGTFAGDATERFTLDIKEKTETRTRLEFYAITGKTYTIERSTDMKTWTRVPFAVGAAAVAAETHTASDVGIVSAFATPMPVAIKEFYRLTVR